MFYTFQYICIGLALLLLNILVFLNILFSFDTTLNVTILKLMIIFILQTCRNTIALSVLLHSATLLNLSICSNYFFVDFLWFFTYKLILSSKKDSFIFSFTISILNISFQCLPASVISDEKLDTDVSIFSLYIISDFFLTTWTFFIVWEIECFYYYVSECKCSLTMTNNLGPLLLHFFFCFLSFIFFWDTHYMYVKMRVILFQRFLRCYSFSFKLCSLCSLEWTIYINLSISKVIFFHLPSQICLWVRSSTQFFILVIIIFIPKISIWSCTSFPLLSLESQFIDSMLSYIPLNIWTCFL